jgi:large subunit ribosomal protein L5e
MGFVKIVKNKAYSKRMQVKPKRRRQGKTDYYARRRLVQQDKNKYDSKKYRLVVRRTNTKIIAQIIFSTMTGDRVFCAAESTELKAHGLTAGLTNYSASYSTGLLLARRLLKQVGLDTLYATNSAVDGEYYNTEENVQDKRPFKALLDVGIQRTTTGARLFGVLKGACDGGINVPHNTKRFPGYTRAQLKQSTREVKLPERPNKLNAPSMPKPIEQESMVTTSPST